eukprot:CAMPEP_0197027690 /NCGR_PEP_ID=MMETSP1384-20130603/7560_1 /TAXON_ID=29189 /ORGANISM="Ammonia sp." /LENGTH=548 /DNA_ID=CAMNT_0042456573 /DNA_START=14 /DNA_END=1660 /DNA_ORIENTATION=-
MSSKKTSKQKRAEIASKRKRMGMDAADADDADDGVAYDPQLLCIARDRRFLQVFEKKAGSLHGSLEFDEFCECLNLLGIEDYDTDTAKKAFKELDADNEDELEFEPFVHAVHGAYPKFNLLWIEIMTKKKYTHFSTLEGPYGEDQLVGILKQKGGSFKDAITALRVVGDMVASPHTKDVAARKLIVKMTPGLLAALRNPNGYVVRCACLTVADIAKAKKANMRPQVAKFLNICWELFDSKNALAAYSASMLSKALLKYVPDDNDNKVLKTLIQGTQLKDFDSVQRGCYEGIKVYLKKAANPKAKVQPNKEFWSLVQKTVQDGLNGDDKVAKQRCYEVLVLYEKANDKKAARIITSFNVQQAKEYENVKSGGNMDDDGGDEDEDKKEEEEERAPWQPDTSKRGPRELSRDYDERKEQLAESFDAYDDEGEGYITTERCQQFLRDLFDCTGQEADIAIKGLDTKLDGHITKPRMLKWGLAHSWEKVRKNAFLDKEGNTLGYKSSRKERLQQRLELFEKLKEIELAEHNYAALYDIDHRCCVLNYFIKQKK